MSIDKNLCYNVRMGPRSYSHVCLLSHPSTVPSRPLQLLACPRHGDGALPCMANASTSLVVEMGFLTMEHSSGQQPFSRVFYAPPGATLWLHRSTPWIHPFGCAASSSLGRVYSRQAAARNCENSAVSFVMKYCPISTTFRNPASIQNLLNLSCCDNFSIRSPCCCNRRSLRAKSSQSKGTTVLITLGTNEELDCPPTTGFLRSIVKSFVFFTHFCDCSVKTELIYRNNYTTSSLNQDQEMTIVLLQIFSHLEKRV